MKILALDASTEALSVALFDSDAPDRAREVFEIAPRAHATRLLPAAQQLLDDARLGLADLDGIAFARGPGAFTGLRIAAGLVQGLAGGANLPVVGISTLAAIAARAFDHDSTADRVQVVQDARMGEIYTATYERGGLPEPMAAERVMAPADLMVETTNKVCRAGNGWSLVVEVQGLDASPIGVDAPHAIDVARLAWPLFADGRTLVASEALPVYVRDDVARKPGGRKS
ncbi:tRNA (adenosine(37)-N6)-threonylcarbamoyltransferase complex dimerization subunit type 1 TsaB [Salinisphaera hydrothermalis]|uniref:tRNA threonylcarbamoyladenosine biosynthesis protein TsaB n=1 Tax=Salinisphaera hydrothermalis (strain C41B8) TaxID=1304275 RepID=A0A084IQC3_SALHC|nr:tRNA (adenosine(37)-N6)-threonylcarbamoyltransferase complex dimerization subunit type 1 TsaB [Salinisphaera hydrothermalis]KEZ78907.1 peptidase M22 glycoprotease [Salinisphaera hydrothermalis C41B8]